MSQQFWWYLARAGGMASWFLLALSVLLGLLISGRVVPRGQGVAWVQDLHKFFGGVATVFTATHLVGLVADNYVHFGFVDLVVPMASSWRPGAVAWGVVGLYLLFAIEVTSIIKRYLPRQLWRGVHQLSLPLFVLVSVHAFTAGTDTSRPIYLGAMVATSIALGLVVVIRYLAGSSDALAR
jgi:predicted ferric reductase